MDKWPPGLTVPCVSIVLTVPPSSRSWAQLHAAQVILPDSTPSCCHGLQLRERGVEHLAHVVHRDEGELPAQLLGDVLEVALVAARKDDGGDAGAVRAEHLFLQAADWQHLAAQRDLAGHG